MSTLLATVLAAIGVLVAVTVRVVLKRRGRLPMIVAPGAFVLLAFCLAGLYLVIAESINLTDRWDQKSWPAVTGAVLRSEIVGERAIRPRLLYEYEVAGVRYRGESDLEAPMFGGKRKKYDVAEELASHYKPGAALTVYYSPDEPSISTLKPGPSWDVYSKLALGTILFSAGLFGFLMPLRKRRLPAAEGETA